MPPQNVASEAEPLQHPGPVALHQNLGVLGEAHQGVPAILGPDIERDALLVAGIHLPVQRHAVIEPVAQGVAATGFLNLEHLGAEVGKLQREHVSGYEARQVQHPDPVEWSRSGVALAQDNPPEAVVPST